MLKTLYASCAILFLLLSAATAEQWYFLPNYRHDVRGIENAFREGKGFHKRIPSGLAHLRSPDGDLTEEELQKLHWHKAAFPHRGFVETMPQENVYGWYACEFDVPKTLRGLDVLADLGIIDDTDECFVNGHPVGGVGTLGQSHPSAWRTDRLYRLPSSLLALRRNHLAVHVWSQWGLGGIVGPPVLKATPLQADSQWEVAIFHDTAALSSSLDEAATLGEVLTLFPSPVWQKADIPLREDFWQDGGHFALFRIAIDFPSATRGKPPFRTAVTLDIGPVFDVASFYLNGRRIGRTGCFPSGGLPAFTEGASRARCVIQPRDWSMNGRNELAAIVYRERGVGGFAGIPGILLENPSQRRAKTIGELSESFDVCLQSLQFKEARKILKKFRPANDAERARLLSHKAHLSYLEWRSGGQREEQALDEMLDDIAWILGRPDGVAPGQSAMQAFCQVLRLAEDDGRLMEKVKKCFPKFNARGAFLPPDRRTRGDWPLKYGTDAWMFGAMGQRQDFFSGSLPPLGARLRIPDARDWPRLWLPRRQFNLDDRDALTVPDEMAFRRAVSGVAELPRKRGRHTGLPVARGRVASWWDDHGEMHPFDDDGPDLVLELEPSRVQRFNGALCVTLHHQDYDWRHTFHPRQQSVVLLDENGGFLNAAWLGKTDRGVYLSFLLEDRKGKIQFRSIKHRGASVALSAFLVDRQSAYPGPPQTKPASDWHPTVLLGALDGASRQAAERVLVSRPGTERIQAGREFLAIPSQVPATQDGLLARTAFLAIASDATFSFWKELDEYRDNLRAMNADTLERLLYHFSFFQMHPRWAYLAANELLPRIPQCDAEQARRLLGGFALFCRDSRQTELRREALALWRRLGLPEEDDFYRRLARTVPATPE
ncbi:MAG: hypothetical protein IJS15_07390 [Victivallales bacterium]|nr:hypothetical protein [Victivallales bacterium]